MESQNKANFGVMGGARNGVGSGSDGKKGRSACDLVLRILALVLTLAAAIVLGVNKQTKMVSVKVLDTLPPVTIPAVAKWHYLSAFVYFVVSNAIACSYAAISLVLSVAGKRGLVPIIITIDLLMVALLFSSIGASAAIGVMGYQGNSHVRWNKVCNVFGRFCNQVAAAVALSLFGALTFLLLVGLAAFRLHKKSK